MWIIFCIRLFWIYVVPLWMMSSNFVEYRQIHRWVTASFPDFKEPKCDPLEGNGDQFVDQQNWEKSQS